jgi:hypothetical protein
VDIIHSYRQYIRDASHEYLSVTPVTFYLVILVTTILSQHFHPSRCAFVGSSILVFAVSHSFLYILKFLVCGDNRKK